MSIPKFEKDVEVISKLDDYPNDVGGLSSTELKAKFDEAVSLLKAYINETLIPELIAANLPFAQSTEIPVATIQEAIENVQRQAANAVSGSLPNNTVGMEKLTSTTQTAIASGVSAANALPSMQRNITQNTKGVAANAEAIAAIQQTDETQNVEIAKIPNKADKSVSATFTLTASGWDESKKQTVSAAVGTERNGAVGLDTSAPLEQWQEAARCGVKVYSADEAGITFTCDTVPELDLSCAYILI